MKYESPGFHKKAFTCPFCDVYANFAWTNLLENVGRGINLTEVHRATCSHCQDDTVWLKEGADEGTMLWPRGVSTAPLPHDNMPADVKKDYLEARTIVTVSPRGAAALLRLSIQKLCVHLGEGGNNINNDIAALVKKGLPVQIQQSLDIVRVTGNNAVHPGELKVEDNPAVAAGLFGLVNLIVDNRIAEPARIKSLFESLPAGAKAGIEKRDT
jgi:uncharacterized protein DUF4145